MKRKFVMVLIVDVFFIMIFFIIVTVLILIILVFIITKTETKNSRKTVQDSSGEFLNSSRVTNEVRTDGDDTNQTKKKENDNNCDQRRSGRKEIGDLFRSRRTRRKFDDGTRNRKSEILDENIATSIFKFDCLTNKRFDLVVG